MSADPVLQTKLNVPPLRSSLVKRTRLINRLINGNESKIRLICAPAGYGKTTLVTEWLQTLDVKCAWLSLDQNDNDSKRFLIYLLAAFRQIEADIGQMAEMMLRSPQPPPDDAILTTLVNDIARLSEPFVLVLDDYHVIQSPPIQAQLNFLLDHQPRQLQLVLITREDPPLPLPRLRARGQLTEIRQNDLRFSSGECSDFLQRVMGINLSSEDVTALELRTEGWIAGLQLAALSMQGHEDPSGFIQAFAGSSRFILDYLLDEVFERQSPAVKDFLLKTSILERMCASLCDALIGEQSSTNSAEVLQYLDHSNLFIIPLDQPHVWYRYHRLFADLLRQRMQSAGTVLESDMHRRASQWFEKAGFFADAIGHSLAASDWERAVDLIGSQTVGMLGRGELMTLMRWFKSLPEEVIRSRSNLSRDYGWSLTLTGQFDAAQPFLDCAERLSQRSSEQLGQVMVAQAYLARARGDNLRAVDLSRQSLALIREGDVLHRGLVMFTLGFALLGVGQFAEAEQVLTEACEFTRASGNDYARLTALGLLGSIQKNKGRLHRAGEFCRQAIQEAHGSPAVAQTQVFLASILYEWNDLDGATDQLEQAHKACLAIRNLAILPEIYRLMVRIKHASGDPSLPSELLNEIQKTTAKIESPVARALLAAVHAEWALMQGDVVSASHWAHQMTEGVDPASMSLLLGLIQARLLMAERNPTEAERVLAGIYESVAKMGLVSSMIEIRAMQAVATPVPNEALQFLREALSMAQSDKFIRTFVDLGDPMKFLLERLKADGGVLKDYVLLLLSAFGEEKPANFRNQPLAEAMSERELEILRLMAMGLSNRDIAERLVITVGTTKSHVHHILDKLGTESRTQATAKARELGLV